MSEPMIQVERVWKKYRRGELYDSLREWIPALAKGVFGRHKDELAEREFWALRDVSFEVRRGEPLGIIGPNGAGKSTMLKMLSKIIRPTMGECRVRGRISALIEVGAGFHQDLTGRENIYLNGTILGMKRKTIKAKEEEIIEFAGVREFIDTPVKRYSSGMKARLGFAVAAHMDPDILLIDEVLSVGDAKFRQKCVRHIRGLISSDVTVIFISHVLDQVRMLCPNTIVLDRGSVVYNGESNGAIQKYLELLADDPVAQQDSGGPVTIRNIRCCDSEGEEVGEWKSREPAVVEMELVVRAPLKRPAVFLNLSNLGGTYIGTSNTRAHGLPLPEEPGTYRVSFRLDPMLLADGDYLLDIKAYSGDEPECVWTLRQPRTASVRGSGNFGGILLCDGQWEVNPVTAPEPEAPAGGRRVQQYG